MTAHDPRVTLTEAERDDLDDAWQEAAWSRDLHPVVEEIIAARLAPIRALAEDAAVSASQDHDGAEGQGEGERAREAHADDCGTHRGLVWCPICQDEREAQHWANEWKKAPHE